MSQFTKIAAPLTQLFHKDTKWFWGLAQDITFQLLKDALTSAEVLAYPDPTKPFFLHMDASVDGLGVCLMQTDVKNPKWHRLVGYASHLLLDCEKRYTVTELEALAVMFDLHYYKYMIQGCDITVVTDHVALKFLMDRKEPQSNRLFRWRLEVADFEVLRGKIRFEYKKGSEHRVPNSLSCYPVGSQMNSGQKKRNG